MIVRTGLGVQLVAFVFAYRGGDGRRFIESLRGLRVLCVYVIGSTMTSTIPGISIAGATPKLTLYTPAVDVEYLVLGKPISIDSIPVTPEGIPTPAVITRAVLMASSTPFIVVDAGSYIEPRIPHVDLPSRVVGGRIDSGKALDYDRVKSIYREAVVLGKSLLGVADVVVLGESIPGGTTTALGIMVALGYSAWGMVSSAGPRNPHDLKRRVVEEGLGKCSNLPTRDPFKAVACLGDPVHIALAGLLEAAVDRDLRVVLAGGTQMAAVLALAKALGVSLEGQVIVGTTRWLIEDESSDIVGLVKMIAPEVPVVGFNYDFSNAPYPGLRYYEKGYVKEGVGAGGTSIAVTASKNLGYEVLVKSIYSEYGRLVEKR